MKFLIRHACLCVYCLVNLLQWSRGTILQDEDNRAVEVSTQCSCWLRGRNVVYGASVANV